MPKLGPFPSKEGEFNTYVNVAVPYLVDNKVRLLVSSENLDAIETGLTAWNAIFPLSQNVNTRTKTIVKNKDVSKSVLMQAMRITFADIPQSVLTAEDRNTLNLEERSTSRTPAPVPSTRPVGQVNTNNRLEHIISYTDEGGSHARPAKVRGCQIWCKEGEPVLTVKELRFLATDTVSPYKHAFDVEDVGKTIHYWLRWENTRGETGPWSNVVSATVTG